LELTERCHITMCSLANDHWSYIEKLPSTSSVGIAE